MDNLKFLKIRAFDVEGEHFEIEELWVTRRLPEGGDSHPEPRATRIRFPNGNVLEAPDEEGRGAFVLLRKVWRDQTVLVEGLNGVVLDVFKVSPAEIKKPENANRRLYLMEEVVRVLGDLGCVMRLNKVDADALKAIRTAARAAVQAPSPDVRQGAEEYHAPTLADAFPKRVTAREEVIEIAPAQEEVVEIAPAKVAPKRRRNVSNDGETPRKQGSKNAGHRRNSRRNKEGEDMDA